MIYGYKKIIEEKIKEAQERGDFDDLPGKGEPLNLEDESLIPEDLRLSHKILKNANCIPPELELRNEIRQMADLLSGIPDEEEKYRQIKLINLKITRLNMMGHSSPLLDQDQIYFKKIIDNMGNKK